MQSWHQNRADALNQTRILSLLLYAMVIIVAVIGGIGIANTLTLNVLERRREIGVMRAIGAGNSHLVQAFLTEALFLGGGGYLLGLALGYPAGAPARLRPQHRAVRDLVPFPAAECAGCRDCSPWR